VRKFIILTFWEARQSWTGELH